MNYVQWCCIVVMACGAQTILIGMDSTKDKSDTAPKISREAKEVASLLQKLFTLSHKSSPLSPIYGRAYDKYLKIYEGIEGKDSQKENPSSTAKAQYTQLRVKVANKLDQNSLALLIKAYPGSIVATLVGTTAVVSPAVGYVSYQIYENYGKKAVGGEVLGSERGDSQNAAPEIQVAQ